MQNDIDNAGINNVEVKIDSNRIKLETKTKGEGQSFSGLSGTAYNDIFVGENVQTPGSHSSTGTTTTTTT